jgi:hypothetical protein
MNSAAKRNPQASLKRRSSPVQAPDGEKLKNWPDSQGQARGLNISLVF